MKYGVQFGDYHTLQEWGLYTKELPSITSPVAKTYYVDVPGGDGSLDLTEAFGTVSYCDRTMTFTLGGRKSYVDWPLIYSDVMKKLHGKNMKIILDRDPTCYYEGRIHVGELTFLTPSIATFDVTATVSPFKWEREELQFTESFSGEDIVGNQKIKVTCGSNASKQSWNTDWRYGTAVIPTFDFSLYESIAVEYTYVANAYHSLQFVDGNGNIYNTDLSDTDITTVSISELTAAGLDPSTIYRILVSGGSNAAVYVYTGMTVSITVEGSCRTTAPTIIVTEGITAVTVNGQIYSLSTGYNYLDTLLLEMGENTMIFSGSFTTAAITIQYRRGWL